ncbi:MAG: GNAT family N-acetyltransferase [Chloroflexi bacterium]|nr:GNAT family N-acetyltransferase [Chloroflexota bacterium]MBI3170874.1 GNAT family N-acetyltransferase [Chloroflexota bacterium]
MNKNLHLSSDEFAKSIEDNLNAKSHDFAKLPGGTLHMENPTWFTSGVNRAGYNGITCAQFDSEKLEQQVDHALEPFRQTNTPLTWWIGPSSQPGTIGRVLQAHGFVHNRDMIGMAADLRQLIPFSPPKAEYTFVPITNPAELGLWMPLFMDTFGVPASDASLVLDIFSQLAFSPDSKWRHYMLCAGEQVIATSSLHFGGDIAGLYNIATRPEQRKSGLGTSITLLTYQEALKLGYQIGTLQTTYPNALRMYHRMGFEVYCKFGMYQRVWK